MTGTRRLFWILFLHLELFVLSTLVFILLFRTHLFKNVTVFFYRGILLLLFATLITTLIALVIKVVSRRNIFTFRDIILSFLSVLCINLVFFTHVPVTAERSVSVFILGYMNENSEKSLTREEVARAVVEKYLYENKNIQKRFREQITSGNIVHEEGRYKITKRGRFIMSIYDFIAGLFSIDEGNLSP